MGKKKRVFLIVSLLYIVYLIFPFMSDILPLPVGGLNILVVCVLLVTNPRALACPLSLWAMLYFFVLIIYSLFGKQLPAFGVGDYSSFRIAVFEMGSLLPPILIYENLMYFNDDGLFSKITLFTVILLLVSLLYVIPVAMTDVNLLRESVVRGENHVWGIPSYALTHSYMIIIPGILFGLHSSKGYKWWILLILLLFVSYTVYLSYVTTIIILSAIVIFASSLYSENQGKLMLRLFSLSFLFVLLYFSGFFELLLDSLVNVFTGTAAQNKMIEIRSMLLGGNAETIVFDERKRLHQISYEAFNNNIWIGSLPVGGHSVLVDRLGGLGLIGFVPFIAMIITQVHSFSTYLVDRKGRYHYLLGAACVIILLYQKGLFGSEGWLFLFVLLPCFIRRFQRSR